jgi:hypothetical protein
MTELEGIVKHQADNLRANLLIEENKVRDLKAAVARINGVPPQQMGEVLAQTTLALRHIEDARMRLGKAIQHAGDGISINDKH